MQSLFTDWAVLLALDYAEKHKHDYNPILWIDATDEETVRSSFKICAAELGLTVEGGETKDRLLRMQGSGQYLDGFATEVRRMTNGF
ncbi:hypothetical protein QC762_0105250 [Podospora pseudocomata]|uniref:Uncharacterized protein n=1 Tax=Podospora pseudocomata TaxID=2093779 RepID=A0ABR0G2P5_9PEZI|nr:hypothetical protein QC762_0105250 [Podospora pseudocomata]